MSCSKQAPTKTTFEVGHSQPIRTAGYIARSRYNPKHCDEGIHFRKQTWQTVTLLGNICHMP